MCKALNLNSGHYVHFGRSAAQNYGEIVAELDAQVTIYVFNLGNPRNGKLEPADAGKGIFVKNAADRP